MASTGATRQRSQNDFDPDHHHHNHHNHHHDGCCWCWIACQSSLGRSVSPAAFSNLLHSPEQRHYQTVRFSAQYLTILDNTRQLQTEQPSLTSYTHQQRHCQTVHCTMYNVNVQCTSVQQPSPTSYTHQSRDNTSYNAYLQYIPDSTLCTVLCALYFLRAETTVGTNCNEWYKSQWYKFQWYKSE